MNALHVPILTRAYNERLPSPKEARATRGHAPREASVSPFDENVLCFDCETTADVEQRLLFGTYRLYRERALVEEGVFFADDLSRRDKERIRSWAIVRGIEYCSQRSFYWEHVRHIGPDGGLLVALNASFDLATIMPLAKPAGKRRQNGRYLGGYALNIEWKGRDGSRKQLPHPLSVKRLNAHSAIIDIGTSGRVLDVRALYWALTNQGGSLKTIADSLETEHRKTSLDAYGGISDEALDYARNDTIVTSECLWKLAEEYERHPITLHPADAVSPAAIAKAYYTAGGISSLRDRFAPCLSNEVNGATFSAYYGGRVEASIVRQPVPIVKLDAIAMYPSAFVLLGLWPLVIANAVEVVEATDTVRTFLDEITYDALLDPARWKDLCAIVEIEPDGDLLPVRATYATDHAPNIGLNHLHAPGERLWYALPDLVAAKLSGKTPRVVRAIVFKAGAPIETLVEIALRGVARVQPGDNMACVTIELRKTIAEDSSLTTEERDRLDLFLKVLANSGFYGIFAQVTRDESNAYDAKYTAALKAWRSRVVELARRGYEERMAAESAYWDALDACGGIVPDMRYDPRRKHWLVAGEFVDFPPMLLRKNEKRPASGKAHGNIDEITQHVRDALGDDDLTTSDVLDLFREHPWPPSRTLAQREAAAELAPERPEPPRTRVQIVGRKCGPGDARYPEYPGPFFCAPIATLVTSGARLLLMMMQHAVERAGGRVGYMDTDSAFVVATENGGLVPCPGGALRMEDGTPAIAALSWERVEAIRRELGALVPYDRAIVGEHVFKLEDENFALGADGKPDYSRREQLWLYTLAEKRYAVYNLVNGAVRLRDCKEHGFGLYLDPKGDEQHRKAWIGDVWQWEVENALGLEPQRPAFFDRLAVSRLVFSTPAVTKPFDDLSLGARIRPFRFMLTASARPHDASLLGVRTRYVAPFEKDPERWASLPWVNLYSHEPHAHEASTLGLTTIARYIVEWEARARVVKMLTPEGTRVTSETRGLLVPMHVVATAVLQTGRETVESEPIEDGEIDWRDATDESGTEEPANAATRHQVFRPDDDAAAELDKLREAIRESDISRLAREAGISRRQVHRVLAGAEPGVKTRKKIESALRKIAAGA
jgi:DNA-binding phage protein